MKTKTLDLLKQLQADSIVLFMKLHNFHWNVKGHDFHVVHKFTQAVYEEFADMFDDLAERVVQLGHVPVVTLAEALKVAHIKEESKHSFHSKEIFEAILHDYEHLEKHFSQLSEFADEAGDKITATYADEQLAKLQKSVWMLKASLA
ncbi:Non-specific DNA-binding protein Dps / Iron-binding ferritin-like antioxidant protein / Ferroxidase [Helicobacter heilmannii]|uniref:Dps family protein n=1 Tax=Helicobacter heilmannii TaxID=35817 RepID=UPI0006A0C9BF|nr:DNA starvation/stationary phase protection protein [Helicobacter heilmannii]CRF46767.1 Non-specific DNA-binding protein Dps / Iron-binding ferritin-like antioxidant protein / Ferroxidase [Helicobacter heilmannii]CRF49362.1 Non-specific DNA-binding protein Dps / Iron-binding ferritin-like antioxidant protein / Ferroxidase [Helicobacter heilmannii]